MAAESPQLPKVMGWAGVALFTVGWTIGSGIFRVPSEVSRYAGSTGWMTFLWFAGFVWAIAAAAFSLELAVRLPRSGGRVVYIKEAFGPGVAFVYGWMALLFTPAAAAAVARTFADYAGSLVPMSEWSLRGLAAAVLGFHTVVAIYSTRWAASLVSIAGAGKIAALLSVLLLSFGLAPSSVPVAAPIAREAPSLAALALAFIPVIWAYSGNEQATLLTGEVRRPDRDMPIGIVLGTAMVALLYVSLNLGFVRVLGLAGVQTSTAVAADTMGALLGRSGAVVIAAVVMASTFVTNGAQVLGFSRILYAMAQDGLFFRPFGRIHPVLRTPWLSITQIGGTAIILSVVGNFSLLIRFYILMGLPFFVLAALGAIRLRQRDGLPTKFRMPFYPWPIVVFVTSTVGVCIVGLCDTPGLGIAGLGMLAVGAFAYRLWRRTRLEVARDAPN